MFLFAAVVATLCGVLFGMLPAWRLGRTDPQEALKSGSRSSTEGRMISHLREILVGLETGLGTLCLVAGGLLLHSFVNLMHVDKGFDPEHLVTVDLNLPGSRFPDRPKRAQFLDGLLSHLRTLPGVVSVGVSNQLPLHGEGSDNLIVVEGANLRLEDRPLADIRTVNPEYFGAMGIPVLRGRTFKEQDRNVNTSLVSAITAAKLWPGQNAIGKRLRVSGDSPWTEVLGICGDVRGADLKKNPTLTVYVPYWQRPASSNAVAIRTAIDPTAISTSARLAIHQLDPDMPVPSFKTMNTIVSQSVAPRRFQLTLVLLFSASALLLACLGIYGVVSYWVAQRTAELGIRAALGAQPSALLRTVVSQGMVPVLAGLVGGLAASLVLGRILSSLLFGLQAVDPVTMAAVAFVLIVVALLASYIPARRAIRIDPMLALRYE